MCKNERSFCVFAETCDKSRCKREIIVITVDSVRRVAHGVENAGSIAIFSGNDGFLQDVRYFFRPRVAGTRRDADRPDSPVDTLCGLF